MNLYQFSKQQINFIGGKARMTAILYVLGSSRRLEAVGGKRK